MNYAPEEIIVAFVDGQLRSDALTNFEILLLADPTLARRVAEHRWMTRQIVAAYPPPIKSAQDGDMISRLVLGSRSRIFASRRGVPSRIRSQRWTIGWTAIAASLLIAVMLTNQLSGPPLPRASGALALALTNQVSGDPGSIKIGVTFRTKTGLCRTFSVERSMSGFACRRGNAWVLPFSAPLAPQEARETTYKLAGEDVSPAVMSEVDRLMIGEPLTTSEELSSKAANWQK